MTDEWDFYFLRVDDEPASIFIDMGIARSAPMPGFDKAAYLRVWMNNPRPDGLSSQEEYEALVALEEAVTVAVEKSGSTAYVGRNTSSGRRDFFFYTREDAAFMECVSAALSKFAEYKTEIRTRADPDWNVYLDFLYPNADEKQRMANRGVIEALGKHGDDGRAPRQIDHLIIVGDRQQADRLARAVTGHGFALKPGTPTEQPDALWWVEFHKVEAPVEIDEATIMLSRLAREHDGEYDGWGGQAVVA
jgi:regulator of RNase E activity RraB